MYHLVYMPISSILTQKPGLALALLFGIASIVGGVAALFVGPGPAYLVTGFLGFAGIVAASVALLFHLRQNAAQRAA